MEDQFTRTAGLLGKDALNKLKNSAVAVFGLGGVGSYTVEALARAGVGALDLIDGDTVAESNINRQIIALHSTIGMKKAEAERSRVLDINPSAKVRAYDIFYSADTAANFDFTQYDYIVDAVDSVSAKIALAVNAQKAGTPIISSMGTANKLNPKLFEIDDIYNTSVCPLARVMRRELKKHGVTKLKALYSKEQPILNNLKEARSLGSVSFVPSAAGLMIAAEVIKDLTACQ